MSSTAWRSEGRCRSRNISADTPEDGEKQVYYFSLEFLLGPLLDNYLLNLGCRDVVADALAEMGSDIDTLCRQEVDPGLGEDAGGETAGAKARSATCCARQGRLADNKSARQARRCIGQGSRVWQCAACAACPA